MWRADCSRVTHPFAARVPRRALPLDLHVLSTPPAFVLSQDQTFLFFLATTPRERSSILWCSNPSKRTITDYCQNHRLSYQRNRRRLIDRQCRLQVSRTGIINSSTFGTLLSSQGSSAHHCQASRLDTRGNLQKLTGCDLRSQIRFLLPAPGRNTQDLGVPGPHRGAHPDHLG